MALDPSTSDELRLDRRQLLALAYLRRPPGGDADSVRDHTATGATVVRPTPEDLDALRAAGLIDGSVHPDVAGLAAAVADPIVRLVVDRVAPAPAVRCPGWVDSTTAVLALPQPHGPDQILAVPVSEVVLHLAALISLGPRPDEVLPSSPAGGHVRLSFQISASWYGPGGTSTDRASPASTPASEGGGSKTRWEAN